MGELIPASDSAASSVARAATAMDSEAGVPDSYVLNPALLAVRTGDDEVLLRHGTRSAISTVIADEARTGLIGRIFDHFREPASIASVLDRVLTEGDPDLEDDVRALIDELLAEEIVVPTTTPPVQAFLGLRHGGSAAAGISNFAIGVVGEGRLARKVVRELAELGPRSLVVQPELFTGPGPNSDEAIAGNPPPRNQVTQVDGLDAMFEAANVLICASGAFRSALFHEANARALERGKPWIVAWIDGSHALIGPLFLPGDTLCYSEFEVQLEGTISYWGDYLAYRDATAKSVDGTATLGAYETVVAGWLVAALVPLLCGGPSFLAGEALIIDFERALIDQMQPLRLPRCPACHRLGPRRHSFQ